MKKGCLYITITTPPEFKKLLDNHAKKQMMKRSEFIRAAVFKYIEFLHRKKLSEPWKNWRDSS